MELTKKKLLGYHACTTIPKSPPKIMKYISSKIATFFLLKFNRKFLSYRFKILSSFKYSLKDVPFDGIIEINIGKINLFVINNAGWK